MEYNNTVELPTEMEYTYVRYGQGPETIPNQFSSSQYGSSTQPAQYRTVPQYNTRTYKAPSQYGTNVQYDDGSQYTESQYVDDAQYDDGALYGSVQYESGSSFKSSQLNKTQSNYPASQSSWQTKKFPQEQETATTGRSYGAKGYARGGQNQTYSENFREHPAKDARPRGRGAVASAPAPVASGRSSYSSQGAFNNTPSVYDNQGPYQSQGRFAVAAPASQSYEDRYASNRGGMKPVKESRGRGTYQKAENGRPRSTPYPQGGKFSESASAAIPAKPVSILKKTPPQAPLQTYAKHAGNMNQNAVSSFSSQSLMGNLSSFMDTSKFSYQEGGGTAGSARAENGEKRPWKTGAGGIRKKKKKSPAERNMRLKKYVQPKNAVMCLNELVQGIVYNVENDSTPSGSTPICISVEVNGQKYRGIGSSKQIAKQAAAEAALVSFVKPPNPSDEKAVDPTPWGVLASFAMYKLFNEWREGRIGMCNPGFNANPFGMPLVQDPTMAQTLQSMLGRSNVPGQNDVTMTPLPDVKTENSIFNAILGPKSGTSTSGKEDPKQIPNPAKQVPENADSMHPVMLLHQMRPDLAYDQTTIVKNDQQVFRLTCTMDNKQFTGEGSTLKKAKLELAIKANKQLYGVETKYQAN